MRLTLVHIAFLSASLALVACDPQSPVESTDVDSKIAEHNQSGDHPNLTVPIGNVTGDVTTDRIADGTIGAADLSTTAVNGGTIQDESVTGADIQDGTLGGTDLAGGIIGPQHLALNAVDSAAIAPLAIITTKLNDNAVTTIKIADNQITGAKILDGEIANADIAAAANIAGTKLANDAITSAKIMDGQVQNGDLAADAVTTAKILDGEVQNGDLGADSVTSAKIMNGQVALADLATDAVDSTKILNNSILTADIADASVTNGGITDAKLNFQTHGRSASTAAVDFLVYKIGNAAESPGTITVSLACGAEAGTAGTILVRRNTTNMETFTCPANAAAQPEVFITAPAIPVGNNDLITLRVTAGAAASAVVWRNVIVYGAP